MKVTFLGTGTSRGVPIIGCQCRVCHSSDPRNHRLRTSILLQSKASIVIDTSVDFRSQMLRYGVKRLDAVLFTHSHADHILGLDDVYPFNIWSGTRIPAYGSEETLKEIKLTFRHLFEEKVYQGVSEIDLVPIEGNLRIGDLDLEPIQVFHGQLPVLGFRVGSFAYVTDVSHIPKESYDKLMGVDSLVLDGLRYEEHPTHFSLAQAADAAARVGAKETYLVHMTHDVDHEEGNAYLPDSVQLAYDGLVLEL